MSQTIGFLGTGKMGGAVLNGVLSSGLFSKDEILLYSPSASAKFDGFNIAKSERELCQNSDIIIIAIKPQICTDEFISNLNTNFKDKIIISVMAGKDLATLKRYFSGAKIIRSMPNTPAMIGRSTTTFCTHENLSDIKIAIDILNSFGTAIQIDEKDMDLTLPLNGSMPAFIFLFAKGFIDYANKRGFDSQTAREITASSIIGAMELLLKSEQNIDTLIDQVCSKGGTTLAGIEALNKDEFLQAIAECATACTNRSIELNKK